MEVTISADVIIKIAALLTALGVIGGAAAWCIKFVQRQQRQDKEIAAIREEQTVICYGLRGALQGLIEQGCNGPCKEALKTLDKHLNKSAHHNESE